MQVMHPQHGLVEIETDSLAPGEVIVGCVDEYGTVTDINQIGGTPVRIGDVIQIKDHDGAVLILRRGMVRP